MTLSLKPVETNRGSRWVSDAWRLFLRRPLAFSALFALYFTGAVLLGVVLPAVGGLLVLMSIPLLGLGFMIASQSALLDGPVHPRQFIEPLRTDGTRRRALIILCVAYGLGLLLVTLLAHHASGGVFERFQDLQRSGKLDAESYQALMNEPGASAGMLVLLGLSALLAIPFWHAPALVHWGGQGAAQALFSSALAVWRAKGAFVLYTFTWIGQGILIGLVVIVLPALVGLPALTAVLLFPAVLTLYATFYISLLFTFNDSFGGKAVPPMDDEYTRPDPG
jgi:hypothetical protein